MVRLKHRSREFCELLALLDAQTLEGQPIHLILDPVSSHWSADVTSWLHDHSQRTFVFHFLPDRASWLSFYRGLVFDLEPQMPTTRRLRERERRQPADRGLHIHLQHAPGAPL